MDYWRGGTFKDYRAYVDTRVRTAITEILNGSDSTVATAIDAIITLTAFSQLAPDGGTPSTDAHIHLWGTVPLLYRAKALTRALVK
jgi:hypothetical protein